MHLLYYDEVKYDPPNQESYWLGGLAIPHALVPEIEASVNEIAEKAFGTGLLTKESELHGIELCRGSGNFKGRDFKERIAFLESLLAIIAREDIFRIRVKINPVNITDSSDKPSEIAFMFFVECADALLREKNSLGMLFGDYDEPNIGTSVATLSEFRRGGTRWARAKSIERLIDTVHFAKSHHSRMIQLADIFLYCNQFCQHANTTSWRQTIATKIVESGILKLDKSRNWPQERYWYR